MSRFNIGDRVRVVGEGSLRRDEVGLVDRRWTSAESIDGTPRVRVTFGDETNENYEAWELERVQS